MKIVKLTVTLRTKDWLNWKKNNDAEYTSFINEIIETIKKKTEAISMSEHENLTKVKIYKS